MTEKAATVERPAIKPADDTRSRKQPPYNVVLLDDDDHTYEYVIEMCQVVFGHPVEKGFQLATEVDATGRVILLTTTKEHAELKQEQVHAYGPDWRLKRCKGAMSVILEPAESE